MELRHLRVFLTLTEELHFGRAADRLHVAQSAVSQTLKDLEDEVGAPLLERDRRRVGVTPAGARFAEHARRALDEVERGCTAARRIASGDLGTLHLMFTTMSGLSSLPRALTIFRRAHPDVRLEVEVAGTTEQLEALRKGTCDLGFITLRNDVAPLVTEVVAKAPLAMIVAADHPVASMTTVPFERLAEERILFLREAREPAVAARFRQRCAALGFEPNVILDLDQVELLLSFVASGLGVSLGPSFLEDRSRGIRAVPVEPSILAGVSAVWNPEHLSPAAARFLDVVRAERGAV